MSSSASTIDLLDEDARASRRARSGRSLRSLLLLVPGLIFIAAALVWPLVIMFRVSLLKRFPGTAVYTIAKYAALLDDNYFIDIAIRTFALGLVVTMITAVLGYPVAWYLARSPSRWRHLVFLGVIFPLLVSVVVRTVGWTILLGTQGVINKSLIALGIIHDPLILMESFWSVAVGLVHVLLPFMILSIAAVLGRIDKSYSEAAATLGATPTRNFLSVTLPLSIEGLAGGSVIVFCLTIGTYITPIWLGRGHVTVLAISIFDEMVTLVDWPTGAALGMLLTTATLLLLGAYGVFLSRYTRR
jgi:putative spermidine/putrescine transport system permease protein